MDRNPRSRCYHTCYMPCVCPAGTVCTFDFCGCQQLPAWQSDEACCGTCSTMPNIAASASVPTPTIAGRSREPDSLTATAQHSGTACAPAGSRPDGLLGLPTELWNRVCECLALPHVLQLARTCRGGRSRVLAYQRTLSALVVEVHGLCVGVV